MNKKKVGILGSGGLGRTAAQIIEKKTELQLVCICDTHGIAYDDNGISSDLITALPKGGTVASIEKIGRESANSIDEVIKLSDKIDGIFIALPNLPNEFIPSIVEKFAKSGYKGVMVDAIKRTRAVELIMGLKDVIKESGMVYITGAGATPGLLTGAAAIASQSFMEIEDVVIYFGVGISNWDEYRATVREDIAHMSGFSVEKVAKMTDAEVEAELDSRNGILELVDMEHADDVMLEMAGIVGRDKVRVGGIVDTRNSKKPVSTNVKITGITFEGKRSTHTFTLGDETSMAANVNGPALGYMKTGFWLSEIGQSGVYTAADVMPKFVK